MDDKRERIAAAADRLFYSEGFAAVGIDRIAAEAEVALGTLYKHFGGRADVAAAALAHRDAAFLSALRKAAEKHEGAERVLALFTALDRWMRGEGGNGCFFLRAASAHPGDERLRQVALDHKQAYLDLIREQLEAGGWRRPLARDLAEGLFLLLEGAVAATFLLGEKRAMAQARRAAGLLLRDRPPVAR